MQAIQDFPRDIFKYQYLAGPVLIETELEEGVREGNCRFALQLYFYRIRERFFERDEIYLPGGYKVLGEFIYKEEPIDFTHLEPGDIVYAENWRNREGTRLDRGIEKYKDKDEWLFYLHSAVYLGKLYPESTIPSVWHATNIEGGPVVWTLDKFEYYYKPVSVKRVG